MPRVSILHYSPFRGIRRPAAIRSLPTSERPPCWTLFVRDQEV